MNSIQNPSEISKENMIIYYDLVKVIINLFNRINYVSEADAEKVKIESLISSLSELNNPSVEAMILERLKCHLLESTHTKKTKIAKYIILKVYGEEVISDGAIYETLLSNPSVFENLNLNENETLEEMLNQVNSIKEEGNFFKNKKSYYEFDREQSLCILKKIHNDKGRLLLHENLLFHFPNYLEITSKFHDVLMNDSGFLNITWRIYLAIMASSTIKCQYLVKTLEELFLNSGGDIEWLIYGLDKVPHKLAKISRLNNILAHKTWILKKEDLLELTKGPDNNIIWNYNELVHACLILTTFHRYSSLIESLDFNVKEVFEDKKLRKQSSSSFDEIKHKNIPIQKLEIEKSKNIIQNLNKINKEIEDYGSKALSDYDSEDDLIKASKDIVQKQKKLKQDFYSKHIDSFCTKYSDFDQHSEEFLSYLDFNWYDNSYEVLRKFFPSAVDHFDTDLKYVLNLTNNFIGYEGTQTNTAALRRIMSCYVEKIMGYDNDDFDYSMLLGK